MAAQEEIDPTFPAALTHLADGTGRGWMFSERYWLLGSANTTKRSLPRVSSEAPADTLTAMYCRPSLPS